MRKRAATLSVVAMVVAAGTCRAQVDEQHALGRMIAPYVDGQTLAVFHADLAAFDASGAVDVLARFLHWGERDRDRFQGRVVPLSVLAGSLPPGARADVFVVISVSDFSSVPFFLALPLDATSPAAAISMEIRRHVAADLKAEIETEQIAGALVTATPRTLARLKKAQPVKRPAIAAAFEAVGETQVQLLFVPSVDARRVFEVLYPKLPAQLGGGPTKQLTRRIEWVAIGLNFAAEQTDVQVVVQAASPEAAASLATDLTALLKTLSEQPRIDGKIPNFDDLAKRLAPQVAGEQLTMRLTASRDEMAHLGSWVLPVLGSFQRMIAKRNPKPPDE